MSLGDFFPEDLKQKFAERNIDIGQSILIKIDNFNINYDKYIVLIGFDKDNIDCGAVVINSEINENLFPTNYLKSLHVEIDVQNHSFLEYNSFINCSEIKTYQKQQLIDSNNKLNLELKESIKNYNTRMDELSDINIALKNRDNEMRKYIDNEIEYIRKIKSLEDQVEQINNLKNNNMLDTNNQIIANLKAEIHDLKNENT